MDIEDQHVTMSVNERGNQPRPINRSKTESISKVNLSASSEGRCIILDQKQLKVKIVK